MKKFLSLFMVLTMLVGMFACIGGQAFAAEEPEYSFVVIAGKEGPDAEQAAALQEEYGVETEEKMTGVIFVDVDGIADEDTAEAYESYPFAYTLIYTDDPEAADTEDMAAPIDPVYMWPGRVLPGVTVGKADGEHSYLAFVSVGAETAATDISDAMEELGMEEEDAVYRVIAVGPAEASEAVQASGQVDVFLTCDAADAVAPVSVTAPTKTVQVVNVGADEKAPLTAVAVTNEGVDEAAPVELAEQSSLPTTMTAGGPQMAGPEDDAISNVSVTYKGNADDKGVQEQETVEDGQMTLKDPAELAEEEGFTAPEDQTFKGWQIDGETYGPDTMTYEVQDGEPITAIALWETKTLALPGPAESYTVTYKSDDAGTRSYADPVNKDSFESYELKGIDDPLLSEVKGAAPKDKVFAGWKIDGEVHEPGAYKIDGDVTAVAVWASQFSITYRSGEDGDVKEYTDTVQVTDGDSASVTLKAIDDGALTGAGFTVPEGMTFAGWKIGETVYKAGEDSEAYTLSENVTAIAQWEETEKTYTITYDPGDGTGSKQTVEVPEGDNITLLDIKNEQFEFTPPADMEFIGWTVTPVQDGVMAAAEPQVAKPGESIPVKSDLNLMANYGPKVISNPQAKLDPTSLDTFKYTKGGAETPTVKFQDGVVTQVSLKASSGGTGGDPLKQGTDYTLEDGGKTVKFAAKYLNGMDAGSYTVEFKFSAHEGTDKPVTLEIKERDPKDVKWDDRNKDLFIDLEPGQTAKTLRVNVTTQPVLDKDYTIDSNGDITLKPAMINGGKGATYSVWKSDSYYQLFVDLNEGYTQQVRLYIGGKTPDSNNSGGASPLTGDETPIALYVVILVAAVVALAAVVIVVKRRHTRGQND